eukprot:scaffold8278_cov27-Tisochrysis_lutea.AAC.1
MLASRPTMDADATGFESRLATAARFELVDSRGELVPPTRSSSASRRAHSRIAAEPATVAVTVVSNFLGAAAAAAKEGSKRSPAETNAGVAAMLAKAASAATAPSRPPYPLRRRVPVASSVASSAAAAAPSAAAAGAFGRTSSELMPVKVPQKAAVASGVGNNAPAASPRREEEATGERESFALSAHVPADAEAAATMRAAVWAANGCVVIRAVPPREQPATNRAGQSASRSTIGECTALGRMAETPTDRPEHTTAPESDV